MTLPNGAPAYKPRFFWRRVFAVILDGVIIGVPLMILTWLVFGGEIASNLTGCKDAFENSQFLEKFVQNVHGNATEIQAGSLCEAGNGKLLLLVTAKSDAVIGWSAFSVIVDENFDPVRSFDFRIFTNVIWLVIVFWFLMRFKATPGKMLAALKVVQKGTDRAPTLKQVGIRAIHYILYLVPLVLVAIVTYFTAATTSEQLLDELANPRVTLAAMALYAFQAVELVILVLIIVSLIRWRGAVIYDRWAGTEVVKID